MTFALVTDSASNLPEEMIDEFGLTVLSLTFYIDNQEYKSYVPGKHTDIKQFYEMMRQGKVVKTSLPNLGEMEKTFRNLLEGNQDILYLGFSSALSGTYDAASLILNQLQSEYPQRTIKHINTYAASLGEGLLVYLCALKAREGASINEVALYAHKMRNHICHWFTVDDLMFLKRGGRINSTAALAGTVLSIKPILHVDTAGCLIPVEKVQGRKKALKALVKHMKATIINSKTQTVFISHGDCIEDVRQLETLITQELGITHFVEHYIDPVIGAHSGPGTLALFYIGEVK